MKTPKLIDEAWIDEQIQYVGTPKNKYDDALVHVMNLVKSKLQPLPTPTKTNVEKIRAGEMAIENDDKEATIKCMQYLFEDNCPVQGFYNYYWSSTEYLNKWDSDDKTALPTIKASELIKEIEGVAEPTPKWQPKFGEVVEARDEDNEAWYERIFLFKHGSFFYCVADADKNRFYDLSDSMAITYWNQIRQKQTPTLTLAEAEAKPYEKTGIELIAEERRRQIEVEGWTAEHDAEHRDNEMAKAAACYAMPVDERTKYQSANFSATPHVWFPRWWPRQWDLKFWKPTPENRIKELVKAGALIAAEIDRLNQTY